MANLDIHGSVFQSSRDTNIQVTNNQSAPKDAMQILKEHVAPGALFNSKERFDPPKCHPDTRKAVLDTINNWAQGHDRDPKPILWLRGAAGAGKSAIAQTSAEQWEELKILLASFFFSRTGPGRNESSRFIPTLAYQLSLAIPSTWPHIEAALLRDVCLFEKSLRTQMNELIIRPLAAVAFVGDTGCHVVIIDGLDECCEDTPGQKYEAQQRDIIEAITFYATQANCPVRFLIASRPERQIRACFSQPPLTTSSWTIVLDNSHNPSADIELFLNCRFEAIKAQHPYLGPSWPPDGTISTLVEKSSGHFIYASTAVRYLERPRQDPRAALEDILNINATTDTRDSPFAQLDALYMFIMRSVSLESLPIVHNIFGVMCHSDRLYHRVFSGCVGLSSVFLERLNFLSPGSLTHTHLVDLHSILEIPPEATSSKVPIRFIHASFSEFLTNHSRSGSFCVEQAAAITRSLSLGLKHIFIQSLQPDFGKELGYVGYGFLIQLRIILQNEKPSPPQGFIEGLTALIGEDEGVFAEYVRNAGLARIGGERNNSSLKRYLTEGIFNDNRSGVEAILTYLKEQGVCNLKTLIEGCEIRDGEVIRPYRPAVSVSWTPIFPGSSSEDECKTPATPYDEHAIESSAATQPGTYHTSSTLATPRSRTSKKRGREVDPLPLQAPAPSGSRRITRSIAKSVAMDAPRPQMAKPVSTAKCPMSSKKEPKEAAAKSKKRRRR